MPARAKLSDHKGIDAGALTSVSDPALLQNDSAASPRSGGSIVQALAIIRYLSESGDSRGVTAIAKHLRLSPSSCYNILKTLVSEDVIEFDALSKKYSIGYGLLNTLRQSLSRSRVLTLLSLGMRQMADKWSVAVGLWQLNQAGRPLLIWLAENEASIRIHMTIGQRLPLLAGAVGRCVAAHRRPPPGEFSRLYAKLHLNQQPSRETYMKEIEKARERGYGIDADCYMRGVTSVAVPVMGVRHELTHCLSATMFSGQHEKSELPLIGQELRTLASRTAVLHSEPIG